MIEKNIYCDICKQRIKSTQLRYVMRRRLIEYDWIGEKKSLDICEECYIRLVELVELAKEDSDG